MLNITIDGRRKKFNSGYTILEAAREMGIHIPTLCYHEALKPAGSCRLCVVEVTSGGRSRILASCVTPIDDGMVVKTNSAKIRNIRRTLLELLLARCSKLDVIKQIAQTYGVNDTTYVKEDEDCFLCGLCVRACEEIVGMSAIGFAHRGVEEIVAAPFSEATTRCISCGTCTTVCPVHTFKVKKVDRTVSMHTYAQKILSRVCNVCGDHYATTE